jgi:hypothetical protein
LNPDHSWEFIPEGGNEPEATVATEATEPAAAVE